eukprot:CAMPEP_0182425902 /NCGR_PEP_ID=MMETSP1167-20130531/12396_1 /TAXON_ID=2988 /ORGANISM="Mallomonas Sp, Strain CCMP3275" /LENGTH=51 /DNA_ID=CAMNT_0024606973 /DNA_START=264 /DNA_END=416 /DNA_ORIENTATION=-
MSVCTSALMLLDDWGGGCVDSLGVTIPAPVWGQWLVCAPLLMFVSLSVEDK